MTNDDRKAAEAAVKSAEKAFDSASKKAETARQKYAEAQGVANAAARALDHARTNPALFDDDPLRPVTPVTGGGFLMAGNRIVGGGTVEIGGQTLTTEQHKAAIHPYVAADPGPVANPAPPVEVVAAEPESAVDTTGAAPAEPAAPEAWEQQLPVPEPAAPAPRKRRTTAAKKAAATVAAPETTAASEPEAPPAAQPDPFAAFGSPAPAPATAFGGGFPAPAANPTF